MFTYVCDVCKGTFESHRPDSEARDEYLNTFGPDHKCAVAIICDDCYQKFVSTLHTRCKP